MRFRKTNPGDLPQLKSLWALGFGDTEQAGQRCLACLRLENLMTI